MTGTLNWPDQAPLHIRWLGSVGYAEAWDLQRVLFEGERHHLLLCTHPPVFTMGPRADTANLLVDPDLVGAELHHVDRGGDITFHGPGQLVGYPLLSLPTRRGGGLTESAAYVNTLEQILIDVVGRLGVTAGRLRGYPGVWVDADGAKPRKLAAIGVRLARGRTMHGFALNVDVDLDWFDKLIPCGIEGKAVTSLAAEGVETTMEEVVALVAEIAASALAPDRPTTRSDVVFRPRPDDLAPFSRGAGPGEAVPVRLRRRLDEAGVDGAEVSIDERKPPWMRVKLRTDPAYLELKRLSRRLDLTTVCEEAGCPNIFDCWNEGTATFMLLGERCTRACGFCLVDTRKPTAVDESEPERIADAVAELRLNHVVLTMVARDDLADGGADIVARSIQAVRRRSPTTAVEVLVSDLKGSPDALARVLEAKPEVFNHNIETVARLQRAVRPSASYARSLAMLARAGAAGATTKSGLIVGMGEEVHEVLATMADLAAVGVSIVTVGQYLRPTSNHLPVKRWWEPEEFERLVEIGTKEIGLAVVQASPLTRSSHHAGSAAAGLGTSTPVELGRRPVGG